MESAAEPPLCVRCDGQALLSARVPHHITRTDGHVVRGTTVVVLCPVCDLDQPAAGALITFFNVHAQITPDLLEQAADLIHAWVDSIRVPALDVEALDGEVEAWQRGEL
ncbi:DUF6300 family protein [Actinomadura kijaniata]|uniref:DUF6300 family protein n=1 Tax=Actinomadura kijaniata TaxID=46161 RepID=UPI003F1BB5C3